MTDPILDTKPRHAITVRYHGPGNVQGPRWVASWRSSNGKTSRRTLPYDHGMPEDIANFLERVSSVYVAALNEALAELHEDAGLPLLRLHSAVAAELHPSTYVVLLEVEPDTDQEGGA